MVVSITENKNKKGKGKKIIIMGNRKKEKICFPINSVVRQAGNYTFIIQHIRPSFTTMRQQATVHKLKTKIFFVSTQWKQKELRG